MLFRSIPDCNNYRISKNGEIFSLRSKKLLHINYDLAKKLNCYPTVVVANNNGKLIKKAVHRFVALTYIPNPENKPTVNHKDGNKLNAKVENLEWSTIYEQSAHSIKLHQGQKLRQKIPIIFKTEKGNIIKYPSPEDAAKHGNTTVENVLRRIREKRIFRDGSSWHYQDEFEFNKQNEIEDWKPVIYKGKCMNYMVSSLGRIKNLKGKFLRGTLNQGYTKIGLKPYTFKISLHKLVTNAFLGLCPVGKSVDHKNRVKSDNRLSNLRYASYQEQSRNISEETISLRKAKTKPVIQLDMNNNIIAEFESASAASFVLTGKYERKNIQQVCNKDKKHLTAYGFKWKWKNEIII